ncbi:MAG: bifunctional oligoribonuclease/PAP phosphatase NrnA [Endomicrobia bacterium]|nr:bifunctional oligoribonuclease/PAP phosphatase NrnA [Endomicrobiia bacterium]
MKKRITSSEIRKFFGIIAKSKTMFITGHVNPDADVIGSSLAIYLGIKKTFRDKKIDIYFVEPPKINFNFIPSYNKILFTTKVNKKFDLGIIIECSNISRAGNIIDISQLKRIIKIDHHLNNGDKKEIYDLDIVYTEYASCAEMVFDIFNRSNKVKFDNEIALCLYVGLVTDTGMFQWGNTNQFSFYTAMKLLSYGVDPYEVYKNIYRQRSYNSIILLGKVLSTLEVINLGKKYKVGIIFATNEMFETTNTTIKDTEDFVNYPMNVAGVNVGIFLKEQKDGTVRVSLRSDSINVEKIARLWSGGGHKFAAGATLNCTIEEAKREIVRTLKSML